MSGGVVVYVPPLQYGETWSTALLMASFVEIPRPREYTVAVLYHNAVTIADLTDPRELEGLIVFRSPPFKLVIE
jgi:hypothetical protein